MSRDGQVERHDLKRRVVDLLSRQDKAVLASVSCLHRVGVLDAGRAVRPVHGVAGGCVEHAGDAADVVVAAVGGGQAEVALKVRMPSKVF